MKKYLDFTFLTLAVALVACGPKTTTNEMSEMGTSQICEASRVISSKACSAGVSKMPYFFKEANRLFSLIGLTGIFMMLQKFIGSTSAVPCIHSIKYNRKTSFERSYQPLQEKWNISRNTTFSQPIDCEHPNGQ